MMKIFKQSYVGIKKEKSDDATAPLAFLVPYEDNAAGKKRMDSVDLWTNGTYGWQRKDTDPRVGLIIDNKPMKGFKIVGWADRWSTDNKTARIADPRGFELEIYIPNLVALIQDTTIVNGEIRDQLIWAREGANNALISIHSEDYKGAWFEGDVLEPVAGDIVRDSKGIEYQYLGKLAFDYVGKERVEVPPPPNADRWTLHQRHYKETGNEVRHTSKAMHLYKLVSIPKTVFHWKDSEVMLRAGPMKIEAILRRDTLNLKETLKARYGAMYHNATGTKWQKEGYGGNEEFFTAEGIEIRG